jgi:hypothetical protein
VSQKRRLPEKTTQTSANSQAGSGSRAPEQAGVADAIGREGLMRASLRPIGEQTLERGDIQCLPSR